VTPEQHLWSAVIERALLDAGHPMENCQERRDAERWFAVGGSGFRRACTLSGIDAEVLQARWREAAVALRSRAKGRK
jgi:hypothetical protein